MPGLSEVEIKAFLVENLPPIDMHDEIVEAVGDRTIRMRLPFKANYLGADQWRNTSTRVFSAPVLLGFAETAMFAGVHGTLGRDVVAVITHMTTVFLRPAAAADLIAEARLVRTGRRQVYVEMAVYSDGEPEPVAHLTATYAMVRREEAVAP